MNVGEAVGRALAQLGVRRAFGVVGSGNILVTNGLIEGGVNFVASRHEGGAVTMADAYARMSGEVAVVSLHPGCGLTNAVTGIGEAAKSRTPLIVVTGDTANPASNFFIDQDALAASVGATNVRLRSPESAIEDARRAYAIALRERRTVVFHLPMEVQERDLPAIPTLRPVTPLLQPRASDEAIEELAAALRTAERPVFIAGRGARGEAARDALVELADATGALLAEGAVAKGLFAGNPWSIDVAGGFSSPLTVELIGGADLVVGWGTALNQWTTRHGKLLSLDTKLVQVDIEPGGLERQRPVDLGIVGDVAGTASATTALLRASGHTAAPIATADDAVSTTMTAHSGGNLGYRTESLKQRIAAGIKWRSVPFEEVSTDDRIDPRILSIALDDMLPAERILAIDSGNFMGHPSMFIDVPDENGYVMTQAFQAIGLGLATAIGGALAQPGRLPVLASGDGGFLMSIAELETLGRLALPMLIVIYNDNAYGAEVYHYEPEGGLRDAVVFPDTDIAAIARGYGYDGITVRTASDLDAVAALVDAGLTKPLVVDAKVVGDASWWLADALKH